MGALGAWDVVCSVAGWCSPPTPHLQPGESQDPRFYFCSLFKCTGSRLLGEGGVPVVRRARFRASSACLLTLLLPGWGSILQTPNPSQQGRGACEEPSWSQPWRGM